MYGLKNQTSYIATIQRPQSLGEKLYLSATGRVADTAAAIPPLNILGKEFTAKFPEKLLNTIDPLELKVDFYNETEVRAALVKFL